MSDGRTRVDIIVETLSQRLANGLYRIGERLPSIRRAAQEHGVSKNTMADAYDRLVAQGLLQARPGSGYYVSRRELPQTSPTLPHLAAAVDLVSLLREQLDQHYEVRPGDGRPPASWTDGSELRRHFAGSKTPRSSADDFGYGHARGFEPLRDRLRLMLTERSITAKPDGLLLTHGANHAMDLIIRHFLQPGDTVLVDEPGYYPLFAKLALAKVNLVGVPRRVDGPDPEEFEQKLAKHRPKLFFTQSQAHNPTGSCLAPAVAFSLLQAAEKWGVLIVENDAFADIVPPESVRLAALDQLNRVIYIGTFSKTLSASLRCGFLAADPSLVAPLTDMGILTTVTTSDFVERFVFGLIQSGQYLRHLRRLRSRVETANEKAIVALDQAGLDVRPSRVPGFYLWAEFRQPLDELDLFRAAVRRSIFLAPGSMFSPQRVQGDRAAIRVNVAHATDSRFMSFLENTIKNATA